MYVKLTILEDAEPLDGVLRYISEDHAFAFHTSNPGIVQQIVGDAGTTSLVAGTLQLEVAIATCRVLFVWGYHPRSLWHDATLAPPKSRPGQIQVDTSEPLSPGVSERLMPDGIVWETTFDNKSGWVRIRARDAPSGDASILIATSTVLELAAGAISAIWLSPMVD
jgi:hypothetical protein